MAITDRRYGKEFDMMNVIIFAAGFGLMLAFVAGAEAVCDWYWGRRRRIPRAARNDRAAEVRGPYGREALRDAK